MFCDIAMHWLPYIVRCICSWPYCLYCGVLWVVSTIIIVFMADIKGTFCLHASFPSQWVPDGDAHEGGEENLDGETPECKPKPPRGPRTFCPSWYACHGQEKRDQSRQFAIINPPWWWNTLNWKAGCTGRRQWLRRLNTCTAAHEISALDKWWHIPNK